jgi:hypothetical protein
VCVCPDHFTDELVEKSIFLHQAHFAADCQKKFGKFFRSEKKDIRTS